MISESGRSDHKRRTIFCIICHKSFCTKWSRKMTCSKACSKAQRKHTQERYHKKAIDYIYQFKIKYGCSKCPEKRPRCLHFHHMNRSRKKGEVSRMRGLKNVIKEIAKCLLLCANCHAVEEHGDGYRKADRPWKNYC